jgi:hypothetical protein
MIKFAEPTVSDLVDALAEAIAISRRIVPFEMHERVRTMYSWINVAHRTEIVYDEVVLTARPSLAVRLMKYYTVGPWAGLGACFLVAALHLYCCVCEFLWPDESIERCAELPWLQEAANAVGLHTRNGIMDGYSAYYDGSNGSSHDMQSSGNRHKSHRRSASKEYTSVKGRNSNSMPTINGKSGRSGAIYIGSESQRSSNV